MSEKSKRYVLKKYKNSVCIKLENSPVYCIENIDKKKHISVILGKGFSEASAWVDAEYNIRKKK